MNPVDSGKPSRVCGGFLLIVSLIKNDTFQHDIARFSIIYRDYVALFVAAMYNIFNKYSSKGYFYGLYDCKGSS